MLDNHAVKAFMFFTVLSFGCVRYGTNIFIVVSLTLVCNRMRFRNNLSNKIPSQESQNSYQLLKMIDTLAILKSLFKF